jgi:uncharacterized coiled-coil protein SlyX
MYNSNIDPRHSTHRAPVPRALFSVIAAILICFAICPLARAVTPAPDGGYDGANTAEGTDALFSLITGIDNTAVGFHALYSNTTGEDNTANGIVALASNTTGNDNTATGGDALVSNTTGGENTADGDGALSNNTTGNYNTANGFDALSGNTTGDNNIALGDFAGSNLTTGNNNIDVGNLGADGESNTIRIGGDVGFGSQTATYVAGIYGVTVARGLGVVIDSNGHLGTRPSSERFKTAIKPMNKASEAVLALKPVTFRYKKEIDPDQIPQFGLVAEEVEKVDPDLVARDADGKPYTVRYEAVNAMLLNEFLREHRKIGEQQTTIGELKSSCAKNEATIVELKSALARQEIEMKRFAAHLKEQDSKIEQVSAQLEMNDPAPQIVVNSP